MLKIRMAAGLFLASLAYAQSGPAGHWEGMLQTGDNQIGLTLDLARNAKSQWEASMGMPSASATGLVVNDVVVSGSSVKFTAVELQMAKFELNLATGGKLTGTASTPRGAMPVEFQRMGEAKVELLPSSPAVSKQLEGDWAGTLQTPGGGAFEIGVHFRNLPDGAVEATLETSNTAGARVPLNDVKEAGRKVEFGIRVAHSAFQGTLNPEGTELTGEWRHEETAMPITLKKK